MHRITKAGILCLGLGLIAALSAAPVSAQMQTDQTEAESVPHGRISMVSYNSSILKESRPMCIYTPPGYEEGRGRYPVLYLLHGEGGDENEWITLGEVNLIIDNLTAQKKAEPMIMVMPNGNANQKISATPDEELFPKSLVKEILPYVKKHYRVENKMESRAIAGLSMGGGQTMMATALYPRSFGYIGVWGAGTRLNDEQLSLRLSIIKNGGVKLYYVGCGVDDQLAHTGSMRLIEQLKKLDMWYRFKETPGGRTWSNWRNYLSDFATQLFK